MTRFLRLFGQNLLIASVISLGMITFAFALLGLMHLIGIYGIPIAILVFMAIAATILDISMGR